jgi:AcrR family transcriptional regulator
MSDGADGGSSTGLPEGIELAWGLRERPGKGPKRALTLQGIVAAAVKVGSTDGLDSLSMSRVASELGVSPMALYRYVPSKNALLEIVMDEVMGGPPELPDPGEAGWREALSAWAWALRNALQEHTWALRIPITGPPTMPNNVRWMEAGLRGMRGMDVPGGVRLSVLMLLSGYVRSTVALLDDLSSALADAGLSEEEMIKGYGRLLASVTDPARFPEVHALIDEKVFEETGEPDEDFVFGLERLLDGIEALVNRTQG